MKPPSIVGIGASVLASCLFAGMFLLSQPLDAFTAEAIAGFRFCTMAFLLGAMIVATGQWPDVRRLLARLRRQPRLILVVAVCAAILCSQLWVFLWAPLHGEGLAVSLGFLLMPLLMVVVGRVVFGERISRVRAVAVTLAGVGVTIQIVGGGLAWPTLAAALPYPVYFGLRRRFGLDGLAMFLTEAACLVPVGVVFLITSGAFGVLGHEPQRLAPPVVALVLTGATAMGLYIFASGRLEIGLFGLLSYLEPLLLVVASMLIGERPRLVDSVSYVPIIAALAVLAADTFRAVPVRSARSTATA